MDESRLSGRAHDDDNPNAREDIRKLKNWPSHSARHFLRELLVNAVLLPLADLTADPDTINQLIITAFDSQQIETEAKDHVGLLGTVSDTLAYETVEVVGAEAADTRADGLKRPCSLRGALQLTVVLSGFV